MIKPFTRIPLLAIFCLLLAQAAAWAQTGTWAPYFGNTHFGYNLGSQDSARMPSAVKLGDLDADGDLDAVISHSGNGSGPTESSSGFTVLLNEGGGYFGKPTRYVTGKATDDLVLADFNNDSKLDVVVPNTDEFARDSTLILFGGLGNGRFLILDTLEVGKGPAGLAAADFNRDGWMDLVAANRGRYFFEDSTVSILINNGQGGFLPQIVVQANHGPNKIAVGDLNGDTLPDIVVANDRQRFTVIRNTAAGFVPDLPYRNPDSTNWAGDMGACVAVADLDNDQDLDVVYSSSRTWNSNSGLAIIRRNMGNGQLDTAQIVDFGGFSGGTISLVAADLNGDGYPELVSANGSGRTGDGYRITVNQSGQFGDSQVRPGGQWTYAVAVGDVNNDGSRDIVTLDQYSLEMTVHLNNGAGDFPSQTLITDGVPFLAGIIESADLDRDGDLDIVISSDSRAAVAVPVSVHLNNGNGTFQRGVRIASAGIMVKARDLNNDSLPDLLYAGGTGSSGYRFATVRNLGGGNFADPVQHNVGVCAPDDIDAADMDLDGDMDVVATGGCGNGIQIALNAGLPDSIRFDTTLNFPTGPGTGPIALGDFNEDFRTDIAAGTGSVLTMLLSDSATGFTSATTDMGYAVYDLLVEDLNDDGHLDVASCNYGSPRGSNYSMSVKMGNGDGTFGTLVTLPAAYSPDLANVSGIACGDIDDDGDLDLMVANNATNDMSVYLNLDSSRFSTALRAGLYYGCRSPWFADYNGDGHCEVAALVSLPPSGGQSAIVLLLGTNSGLRTGGTGRIFVSNREKAAASAALNLRALPNPFSQSATLAFTLPKAGSATLTVYDMTGRAVAQPFSGTLAAGSHTVPFRKESLKPGTYLARLVTGTAARTITLIVE